MNQKNFQKKAYECIARLDKQDRIDRVRAKLRRWKLEEGKDMVVHRKVAQDFCSRWDIAIKTVPPRVRAAMLNTAWNRWTTARRFQAKKNRRCTLGCSATADDSASLCACA